MNKFDKRRTGRDEFSSTCAAAIPLAGFVLFGILPLALSGVIGFTELHSTDLRDMKFVGLKNFTTILTNQDGGQTYWAYLSTAVFMLSVPLTIGLALYIANLVNRTKIGRNFFRTIFFVPFVCSMVVVTMTFKILFATDGGVINSLLERLGFLPRAWLSESPLSFLMVAIILAVWSGMGWCIILFHAALSGVDSSYYEAAMLDGATPFQMFSRITWPAISPTTSYLVTIKLIGAMQVMTETYVLVNNTRPAVWPGPAGAWASTTVVRHIYNMVFESSYLYGYGLAAAAGWILALIVYIVTQVNLKLQDRWVNYDF